MNTLYLEMAANAINLAAVFLAARNSIHTWWLGAIACSFFTVLFYTVNLYAEVVLMLFFVATNITGWFYWKHSQTVKAISSAPKKLLASLAILALIFTCLYGYMLHALTQAYAPFIDSAILMFSILAQFLLMNRKKETWWFWLLVNSLAVPLYFSRDLDITAIVYIGFWFNSLYGLYLWSKAKSQQVALQ